MSTRFAELEAIANAAVTRHLANATVVVGAESFEAVFSQTDQDAMGGVYNARAREWQLEAPLANFGDPPPARGAALTINGESWTAGTFDVDVTGWAKLAVSKA